ncbi:MAG: gephyrin-like molybdotransferase Glp [Lautropia sp.]
MTGEDPAPLSVDQARAAIAAIVRPITEVETVAPMAALDRVLAHDVVSPIDVPAHDNAAMDGYALRFDDLSGETRLPVAGRALAGSPFAGSLPASQALRIMTGAVLPAGADTVVPQEAVRRDGPAVVIPPGQRRGQHCRRRGEDLARGATALPVGRRLQPADLGLLASLGLAMVPVRRRARVALLSSGDELLAPGAPPAAGRIYDSNRPALAALLQRLGVAVADLGVVPDRPDALAAALAAAAADGADAIISSGGVSVGDADHTRAALAQVGSVGFHRVAMRPGRPVAFGRIGNACYFGLPGNPVAAMVTFLFLVRDALAQLTGAAPPRLPVIRALAAEPLHKRPGRTEYQRGVLSRRADGSYDVRTTGDQGSGVLRSMSEADGIIVLEEARGDVAVGGWVDVVPFVGLL